MLSEDNMRTQFLMTPRIPAAFLIPTVALLVIAFSRSFHAESGQARPEQTADAERRIVADGIYTTGQAARGRAEYEITCAACHAEDLGGAGEAPPLVGSSFMGSWFGVTLDGMFDRVEGMPFDAPRSLGTEAYMNILAYILEVNGFPAGADDLTPEMLENILIEGEDGPQPIPEFALVRVVGCLAGDSDNGWVLTHASELARTQDPSASTGPELDDAAAMGLGTGSYLLLYVYPSPDTLEGHVVETKGFLILDPTSSINVTSVVDLGPSCDR